MSQQYPGPPPQQPQQHHPHPYQYAGHAPYQPPPPPPRKGMNGWAIAGITVAGLFAFLIVLGLVFGDPEENRRKVKTAAPAVSQDEKPAEKRAEKPADKPAPAEGEKKKPAPASKPKPEPKAKPKSWGDGDHIVGEDIPAGTYTTPGAESGAFEFCSVTTEPTAEGKFPQLKSANANERIIITLAKSDGIVTIQGCEPLTARK